MVISDKLSRRSGNSGLICLCSRSWISVWSPPESEKKCTGSPAMDPMSCYFGIYVCICWSTGCSTEADRTCFSRWLTARWPHCVQQKHHGPFTVSKYFASMCCWVQISVWSCRSIVIWSASWSNLSASGAMLGMILRIALYLRWVWLTSCLRMWSLCRWTEVAWLLLRVVCLAIFKYLSVHSANFVIISGEVGFWTLTIGGSRNCSRLLVHSHQHCC